MYHYLHPEFQLRLGMEHHRRLLEAAGKYRLARRVQAAKRREWEQRIRKLAVQYVLLLAPAVMGRRLARRIGRRYRALVATGVPEEDAATIAWNTEWVA